MQDMLWQIQFRIVEAGWTLGHAWNTMSIWVRLLMGVSLAVILVAWALRVRQQEGK